MQCIHDEPERLAPITCAPWVIVKNDPIIGAIFAERMSLAENTPYTTRKPIGRSPQALIQ